MGTTTTKKPVGNQKTEVIIGQAAGKIETGIKSLQEAVAAVEKLGQQSEEYALVIVNQENKLAELEQEFKNKNAQLTIELEQSYAANKKLFVERWLTENSMVAVAEVVLADMKKQLNEAQSTLESTVKAEVGKAVGIANSHAASELKLAQLEHEKKEAGNVAEIAQLKSQIAFLEKQAKTFEEQLNAERTASVERSKHNAIGNLTVGSDSPARR